MSDSARPVKPEPSPAARSAVRKIVLHMVPLLSAGYLLVLLDRSAVGFAASGLGPALGLDNAGLGLTAPILFLSILVFEVPSALVANQVGCRRWLAAMLVVWGAATAATAWATGPTGFYIARAVAGIAQAGYIPVAVFMIASWAPTSYRTRLLTWTALVALASTVLGPFAAHQLLRLDGVLGWAGWRWVFLGFGLPCLPLAALVLRHLSDAPQTARWLNPEERDALAWLRSLERQHRPAAASLSALLDLRLLLLAAIGFGLSLSGVASGIWFVGLVNEQHLPGLSIGIAFLTVTAVTVLMWSRQVDRGGRLIEGLTMACALTAVSYAGGVASGFTATMLVGLGAHAAILAAARTMLLSATAGLVAIPGGGAAAVAVVDVSGLVAAFVGPRVVAGLAQSAGSLQGGMLGMVLGLIVVAGLAAALRLFTSRA